MKSLILILLILVGCSSVVLPLSVDGVSYAEMAAASPTNTQEFQGIADLQFSINNTKYVGISVIKHDKYPINLSLTIPKDTDKLYITSCHRRLSFEKPQTPFNYVYTPRLLVESVGSCRLKIEILIATGEIKLGIIDFIDQETQKVWNNCNGSISENIGASFCQAYTGLRQMIQLSEDSDVVSQDKCSPMQCNLNWCFYNISPGYCLYVIKGLKTGARHRLTTRGFTD